MFSCTLCDRISFCIRLSTDLDRCPSSSFIVSSSSTDHPPSTSIIMLNYFTSYPGYCCLSSHLKGLCLALSSLYSFTRFLSLSTNLASILFAHHHILCIDQYIPESLCSVSFSYSGLGWTGQYHDGTSWLPLLLLLLLLLLKLLLLYYVSY